MKFNIFVFVCGILLGKTCFYEKYLYSSTYFNTVYSKISMYSYLYFSISQCFSYFRKKGCDWKQYAVEDSVISNWGVRGSGGGGGGLAVRVPSREVIWAKPKSLSVFKKFPFLSNQVKFIFSCV